MYALKARDKLHKREKEDQKERDRRRLERARELDGYHRGELESDPRVGHQRQPSTIRRDARYIGTFSISLDPMWKTDIAKTVKQHLARVNTKHPGSNIPVILLVSVEGVKVLSDDGKSLIMAHALKRVVFCTADTKRSFFALVAKNPETGTEGIYCHIFALSSSKQAKELSELVGKAFKAAFAKKSLERNKKQKQQKQKQPQQQPPPPPQQQQQQQQPQQQQHQASPSLPWTVVEHQASPSAPWTVVEQPSGGQRSAHKRLSVDLPSSSSSSSLQPPLGGERPRSMLAGDSESQLLQEASRLETEVIELHSRIHELEGRITQLGGSEQALLDLTVQLSTYQQRLDEKGKRLFTLQQRLQGGGGRGGGGGGGGGGGSNRSSGSALPDIDSISLEDAEWFQAGLPREIAMEILAHQGEGAFIVRESSSNPGCFALSLKAPQNKIRHFLIEHGPNGVYLQNSDTSFPDLPSLILHHCTTPGTLPCPLSLGNANPIFLEAGTHDSSGEDDDDAYMEVPRYHFVDT